MKRVLLLLIGLAAIAFLVLRKRNTLPQTPVVNKPANALNTAASQTIDTASQALQQGIVQISGTLFNGIAQSISQWGQGGANGADTGSTTDWGSFQNTDLTGFGGIN